MSAQTITDERDLPTPDGTPSDGRREYIRHKIDPRFLIACRTGEVYVREDGAEWEWPGWRISFNRNTKKCEHESVPGCEGDSRRIAPRQAAA